MPRRTALRRTQRGAFGHALLIAAAGVCVPALAHAHFILVTPDSWMSQDSFGLPEKLGPCGDEGGGTPTGKVTAFHPGETISVTMGPSGCTGTRARRHLGEFPRWSSGTSPPSRRAW